jgi:phage gp29-like protein
MSELMRWAIVLGFAIAEIRWDRTVTPWQPYLVPWHPYFDLYRWDLRQHQLSTLDGPVAAVPGEGKWFVFAPHGQYRGWIQGAIRAIAEIWYIKRLGWRDWARFNERHGLPIITAEFPAAGDPTQRTNFVRSMQTMGQEAVVGLPQNVDGSGYKVNLLEAKDRSWESFMNLIDRCDRSIILPILWQNLTTEVKEGSYAAARVHGDVRQNALEFDNSTLSEAIYEQIARPWAYYNYGDPDVAPFSTWDVQPFEDFATQAEILGKFATAMNQLRQAGLAPRHVRALSRRFGFDIGGMDQVDPVQVEARAAGATGKIDSGAGESAQALMAALRDTRRAVRRIDRDLERRRAA